MKKIIIGFFIFSMKLFAVTFIEDTSLSQDTVYDENVTVTGGVLDLNGYTLTVNGSFSTSGDNARLQMQKTDDKLIVNGDITFGGASTSGDLTKGVIELTGDFYQTGTRNTISGLYPYTDFRDGPEKIYADNAYSFYPTDVHKVVFNGNTRQTVNFAASGYSRFMNIEILNTSTDGVVFEQLNIVGELIKNNNNIGVSHIENWQLTENITVLNDVAVYEILNLNGYTLTVNGSFSTSGDNARLQMQKTDDKLIVNGDITFGGASTSGDLTKGVIELTGDFYQTGTRNTISGLYPYTDFRDGPEKIYADNAYSFYPTDVHKVVFNGNTRQTVNFAASGYSRFMNIEILNTSTDGVVFEQLTNAVGTLYTTADLYNSTYKNSTTLTYANYLDSSYHYLDIKAGMNLISLPNTSDLNATHLRDVFGSDITTVWTFKNGVWNGFSSMGEKVDTLSEQNLSLISSIAHGEGIIVNSLIDKTLLFPKGKDYSIKDLNIIENLSSGWHLLGTNKSISLAEIKLLNPNIVALWSYDTTKWFADATEEDFINNINAREITPLANVESNSAFWAYVK